MFPLKAEFFYWKGTGLRKSVSSKSLTYPVSHLWRLYCILLPIDVIEVLVNGFSNAFWSISLPGIST